MAKREMTPGRAKAVKGGLISGAVLAAAMALIAPWEGTKLDPYKDIVGVWTVCTGETRVQMRRYTPGECNALLRKALESDYAPAVVAAVPEIRQHHGPFVASISLTYNIGARAFARSTVARRFNAGQWRAGCDAFLMWDKAGGKVVKGLTRRREAERQVCLKGEVR